MISVICPRCNSLDITWGSTEDLRCMECGYEFPQWFPCWYHTANPVRVEVLPPPIEVKGIKHDAPSRAENPETLPR